jgi:hypothetical protein
MYHYLLIIFLSFVSNFVFSQSGQLSGRYANLIGQDYQCQKLDNLLKGFSFEQFVELDAVKGYTQNVTVYRKGRSLLIFLHTEEDDLCKIQDVIYIEKLVPQNANVQLGSCQIRNKYDSSIIAIEKSNRYYTAFKVDKDKNKFLKIPTKGINCIVDGI